MVDAGVGDGACASQAPVGLNYISDIYIYNGLATDGMGNIRYRCCRVGGFSLHYVLRAGRAKRRRWTSAMAPLA